MPHTGLLNKYLNQLAKTGKEIGEFLNPTSPKTNSDGSSSANYTNSSSKTGKSSQGSGRKADIKDQDKQKKGHRQDVPRGTKAQTRNNLLG